MTMTILTEASAGAPATFAGTAGRLITLLDWCLVTKLGWAKVFSGTNLAAYRAPTGNRRYLRVNDAAAADAIVRGYEAMTAISTGTGLFPTTAQIALASGPYVSKDILGNPATVHPWLFLSNGTFFHLFTFANSAVPLEAANSQFGYLGFGDFPSLAAGDVYNSVLLAANAVTAYTPGANGQHYLDSPANSMPGYAYVPRIAAGTGTAQNVGRVGDVLVTAHSQQTMGTLAYPMQVAGGLHLSPIHLSENNGAAVMKGLRGLLPGLWATVHPANTFAEGDTFSGTGKLAGRTFRWLAAAVTGPGLIVETSDTWGFV